MTPVYMPQYEMWVQSGVSGFWSAGVQDEMRHCNYYDHQQIEEACPVIVDVGGHIGIYSREMARRYPQGRIFYIEPDERNVQIAELNFKGLENITVIRGALSYEPGVVFHPYKDGSNSGGSQLLPLGSSPFSNSCEHTQPIQVQVFCLERLILHWGLDRIHLLKLDCEGSEYSIIRNSSSLHKVDVICGEWHKVDGDCSFQDLCAAKLPHWESKFYTTTNPEIGNFKLTNSCTCSLCKR